MGTSGEGLEGGGRAKKVAAYPPELVKAVLRGLGEQMIKDGKRPGVKAVVACYSNKWIF